MIGRDTALTDAERAYLEDTIRTLEEVFVDRLGREHFLDLDDNEETTENWREFIRRAGEHGLLGIAVPEEYNGAGGGFVETVLAEEALGYAGCIIHACQASLTQHVGRTLYEHANDYLKEEYLAPSSRASGSSPKRSPSRRSGPVSRASRRPPNARTTAGS